MNAPPRRPRADGSRGSVALLVTAAACVVVLALAAWGRPAETRGSAPSDVEASRVAVMQMNLCLSGLAGCYAAAADGAVVGEAVGHISRARPRAVTFNEACRGDARRIAQRTGYHLRFAPVIYKGARFPCVDPGGRGLFGHAVLTRAPVDDAQDRPFRAQAGFEQRRWLCVTTTRRLDVCTAHLSTRRTAAGAAANDAQCIELRALLSRRGSARAVAFGGDVNRRRSCAPAGFWVRTDAAAGQAPGVQHVYGDRTRLRAPRARVVPARHSDHDVLLVRARLVPRRP